MNRRGFTLMELLLTMAMLAMIVAVMSGALSMAYRTTEKGEKKIDDLEKKKMLFSFIEPQIQSAFVSSYQEEGETKSRFAGAEDTLVFASNYSLWRGTKGNCLVTYRVETDDRKKSVLRIEEQVLGTDLKQEASVPTDYDSIRFAYYYTDTFEEGKWVSDWPSNAQGMPQKLKIYFSKGGRERVLTVKVFTLTALSSVGVKTMATVTN